LITSAWSAASSDLYTSSRAICASTIVVRAYSNTRSDGLAVAGNAPKIFLKTTKKGLPYVAICFCALFTTLGFMSVSSGAGKVFNWFANMTSVAGLMTWFGISVTYIRFYAGLKAQGIDRKKLPFYTNLQPYAAWYVLVATLIVNIVSGFNYTYFQLPLNKMRLSIDVRLASLPP
jgi:amino acid transporter